MAVLAYSYTISGPPLHGEYRRKFTSERDANEFLRGLAGQPVSVRRPFDISSTPPKNDYPTRIVILNESASEGSLFQILRDLGVLTFLGSSSHRLA